MEDMSTLRKPLGRVPAARWLVPIVAAVVFIGGGSAVAAIAVGRDAPPAPSVPQLLADVSQAHVRGLSGTIVQDSNLGLPELPGLGGGHSSDLQSLVSGSHTLRVWYAGPQHVRLSLLGQFGESDVVRNKQDLWVWNSKARTASHRTIPEQARPGTMMRHHAGVREMTPQGAARTLLRVVGKSTRVTTGPTTSVANRPAWQLVLSPRSSTTLVGRVTIAVDTATKVPTRLQVFPRGSNQPAFDVGYTSFDPTVPSMSVFRFNPPPGTKVTQESGALFRGMLGHAVPGQQMRQHLREQMQNGSPAQAPKVVGSGWDTVVVAQAPPGGSARGNAGEDQLGAVMQRLPRVSGSWGSGHLLQGTLFSVLVTDDGRVAAGAVPPSELYAALVKS
jgi:outer membrane lipoprotein-sorting protein